jgi:microcin C transport system substrate-binding protein|tara:strand:- start:480 stop:2342 length:1863 start_codon:yes stop_codon:yes gene_type:complete
MNPGAHNKVNALNLLWPLLLIASAGLTDASEKRHGISFFGDLKYPADFRHFDYVNPDAPKGGTMKQAELGNFDTLNNFIRKGRKATGLADTSVSIYDRLMYDADDEPASQYGWLAETVELADDYSWVVFDLRPEARWHDGEPVTADDVVFTFDRFKEFGDPARRLRYRDIVRAEKTGPHQVKFHIEDATSPKQAQVIARMHIIPKHYWRERTFDETTLEIPLGSGPYRVVAVDPGHTVTLELVEDYWGKDIPVNKGRYNVQKVVYDYYKDEHVIHEAKKVGAVDGNLEGVAKRWATEYDFPGYRQGLFIKNLIKTERPWGMENSMVFNLRKAKFQDVRVREALATAYDFEWANRVLYYSFYKRVDSFFENSDLAQRGLPSKEELELLEPFRDQIPARVFTEVYKPSLTKGYGYARENLLRAARLLKEAGWVIRDNVLVNEETGKPFIIELISYSIYGERAMMTFVNAVKRLGIHCRIRTIEVSQYINRLGTHDFGGIMENYAQTLTPGIELRNYWGSEAASRQYSRNSAGIADPVVDQLIEKVIGARSRTELITAAHALDRVLLWNFYMIPGFWPPGYRYGYWDKFVRPKTQARFRTGFFDTWWIDPEREAEIAASLSNR